MKSPRFLLIPGFVSLYLSLTTSAFAAVPDLAASPAQLRGDLIGNSIVVSGKQETDLTKIGAPKFAQPCFPLENCALDIVSRAYGPDQTEFARWKRNVVIIQNESDSLDNWVTALVYEGDISRLPIGGRNDGLVTHSYMITFSTVRAAGPYKPVEQGYVIFSYNIVENSVRNSL